MNFKTKTILILEDDLIIAENIKENLLALGFLNVHVAKNYSACKTLSATIKPDLFLVDIKLDNSEKDGIDTLIDLFPDNVHPVIYISTLTDSDTRERAKKTNAKAYLVKPFSHSQLEVAIDFAFTQTNYEAIASSKVVIDHCPFISEPDFFYVKVKDKYERINKSEIIYLHSQGTYTDIITNGKTVTHYLNLKVLLERLKCSYIVRCHNSYAVNINEITSFDNETLHVINNKTLPLGNVYKSVLMDRLPKL